MWLPFCTTFPNACSCMKIVVHFTELCWADISSNDQYNLRRLKESYECCILMMIYFDTSFINVLPIHHICMVLWQGPKCANAFSCYLKQRAWNWEDWNNHWNMSKSSLVQGIRIPWCMSLPSFKLIHWFLLCKFKHGNQKYDGRSIRGPPLNCLPSKEDSKALWTHLP